MTKASVTAATCAALLWAGMAPAETPQQKCEVAKFKAQGALQTCLTKNSGNVILGKPDASAACQATFTKALATADKKGPCRYVDNGDGTVSDLNTGLMWEKKTHDSSVHDESDLYTWSTGSPYNPDGTAFVTFLGALNDGTSNDGRTITGCFASHCDWRLPTIVELAGILLSPCSTTPCIDPVFGPTSSFYWSATPLTRSPFLVVWGVSFNGGGIGSGFGGEYVRAVRGGL